MTISISRWAETGRGSARQLLNILLVWLATGLWHGAAWNFVLWGLLYAILLTAEKLFLLRGLQKLRVLNHVYVLLFVTLGFVLFDASSVQDAAQSIRAMFGGGGLPLVSAESRVRAAQLRRVAPARCSGRNAAAEKTVYSGTAQPHAEERLLLFWSRSV